MVMVGATRILQNFKNLLHNIIAPCIIPTPHGEHMKLTPEEAYRVVEHGAPSINNRRHYLRYGGVFYPLASVVWTIETGEWPTSTPRHLDGNPANNDFGNLRKPGRAKARRKKTDKTIGEVVTTAIAAIDAERAEGYFGPSIANLASAAPASLFDPA